MTDFYEDDESVADVLAAWNRLPKNVTTGPSTVEVETVIDPLAHMIAQYLKPRPGAT